MYWIIGKFVTNVKCLLDLLLDNIIYSITTQLEIQIRRN